MTKYLLFILSVYVLESVSVLDSLVYICRLLVIRS